MIIVVYNPRSSKASRVRTEVLEVLASAGREFKTYEVLPTNVDDNARRLSKEISEGDLVVSAGGDGTATIGLNGVVLAILERKKHASFGVLPFGNFNDTARLLGCRGIAEILESYDAGRVRKLYPLEAQIDGKHFRYAACYFTVGMFAESTEIFDKPVMRKGLQTGKKSLVFSALRLFSWWLKNRKKKFFPEDFPYTDILAVNGKTVAKVMKGDARLAFKTKGFIVCRKRLSGFFGIFRFMVSSMIFRVPGDVAKDMKVEFSRAFLVEIQAEGEYVRKKVKKILFKKALQGVEVVVK